MESSLDKVLDGEEVLVNLVKKGFPKGYDERQAKGVRETDWVMTISVDEVRKFSELYTALKKETPKETYDRDMWISYSRREQLKQENKELKQKNKDQNHDLRFLWVNVERLAWDESLTTEGVRSILIHYPGAPWNSDSWDWFTEHKEYHDKMQEEVSRAL